MPRPNGLSWFVICVVTLLAVGVQAQVDWGPLLGEKGAEPAHEPVQHEPPNPTVPPQGRHSLPAVTTPKAPRRRQTPRSRRRVRPDSVEDREYPAVPGGRR